MILGDRAWHIPGYLDSVDGRLRMDGIDLVALAGARGSPLYVYSAKRMVETARRMRQIFESLHPRATICYASKALSAIKALRLIHAEGLSIEVNSAGELYRAKLAGFAPAQIISNGVSKSVEELHAALSLPIKAINVDSLFELSRIIQVARDLKVRANIALRVVPNVDSSTSPGNQTGSEGTKFGIRQSEVSQALDLIRRAGDAVVVVGLHGHIGSQIIDTAPFALAAGRLADLFLDIQNGLGHPLEHINVGGGFPLMYMRGARRSPQGDIFCPEIDYEDIAKAVLPILVEKLGPNVEVIVEPGRRLVGDSAVMLSTVENTKDRSDGRWLYLDAGYNLLVESYTYKWYYHALTANKLDEPVTGFRVAGPLCDNGDAFFDVDGEQTVERLAKAAPAFAEQRELLESLLIRLPKTRPLAQSAAPGDLIAFLDVGAYTLDQFTPNNGRLRPEVGIIGLNGAYDIIRRRDTQTDLLFNEVL
ncbi:MAG TPA: diaminopimelate decarboxylase [Steroidobacteraceae bacterium]|nr:diaminopimelate decarboxylase [Steroidobacteraceae bacterium]